MPKGMSLIAVRKQRKGNPTHRKKNCARQRVGLP
jgi:hypothetical protein